MEYQYSHLRYMTGFKHVSLQFSNIIVQFILWEREMIGVQGELHLGQTRLLPPVFTGLYHAVCTQLKIKSRNTASKASLVNTECPAGIPSSLLFC